MRATPLLTRCMMTLAGSPLLRTFDQASRKAREAQESTLLRILSSCRETRFGKEHGFSAIRTIEDYRKAVPVRTFEGHRSYIDRMCAGEADVLFPGKPIMYATTSGTTAKPKMIPVSQEYFGRTYAGLSRLWLYTCMKDNPRIYDGRSLSAVAPAVEGHVEDGTPYGSISGVVYRNIPSILKKTYSTPYAVICIPDLTRKYYAMMRCAIACDITFIVCPSPSNLLRFHQTFMENAGDLIKDIRDGTLRPDVAGLLPNGERQDVLRGFAPDPRRAAELEGMVKKYGGSLRPRHYWPNLACINVWKQGNFSLMVPRLNGYYAERTVLREFGYQASEARAGMVLGNDWSYSVPAVTMFHFEFIDEKDHDSANPRPLLMHEVEVGRRYYILFTNGSGLYRYDINDIVEVTGFFRQLPLFRFIQKGEGVTSLTGEKLSEFQLIQAVQEVAREHACPVEFYRLFADTRVFAYRLFAEFSPQVTQERKNRFADQVDARLKELNCEYRTKRDSGRLDAPMLIELIPDSSRRFKESLIARGLANDGQYKECFLTSNRSHLETIKPLVKIVAF